MLKKKLRFQDGNHIYDFRTLQINDEIWFVGIDVATILGYLNLRDALRCHCKNEGITRRFPISTQGGNLKYFTIINEINVHRLIAHSKLRRAGKFENWLFKEVLHSLRQTKHVPLVNQYFVNIKPCLEKIESQTITETHEVKTVKKISNWQSNFKIIISVINVIIKLMTFKWKFL